MSTTVRISSETHNILRSMASETGQTIQATVEKAVEEYRRKQFWERTNAAYTALRNNPTEWKEEIEERSVWDTVLADGLEDE